MRAGNVVLVLVSILMAGCAYIDQNLQVAPSVAVNKSDIGKGKKIALRIVDDREDETIGNRGTGYYGMKGAKITTSQDLVEVLRNSFVDNLKNIGFQAVGENEANTLLRVELRALSYDTSTGLWAGANIGKSTIKIIATDPVNKVYEKSYHSQKEVKTVFVGSQETNSKVINESLTETLTKIFADQELWNFLAK